jgi:hypothetical protein|tara:strand:- start:1487 stop:2056 length:570 start_codon:yes stop_codon:yes gene_type:complete
MTVKVKIGSASDEGLTDAELASKPGVKVRLDIRRTLDGNLIISDHPDIDIIVMPQSSKVLAISKQLNSGVVYGAQNRLFNFLKDRGVIDHSSIQGGSVYASLEGTIPTAEDLPTIKITILNVANWLDSEKPAIDFIDNYEDEMEANYTDPDKEYSTELGQVPQNAEKGTIRPSLARGPYGLSLYNSYGY